MHLNFDIQEMNGKLTSVRLIQVERKAIKGGAPRYLLLVSSPITITPVVYIQPSTITIMSPFTALSVAGTQTTRLGSLFSSPTNAPVSWNTPTGSVGISDVGLATVNPVLKERDDSQGPSAPEPYTSPGRLRSDRKGEGFLFAEAVSKYENKCPAQAESLMGALTDAKNNGTYEAFLKVVIEAKRMTRSVEGCPAWTAEEQSEAEAYIQGLVGHYNRSSGGPGWTEVQ